LISQEIIEDLGNGVVVTRNVHHAPTPVQNREVVILSWADNLEEGSDYHVTVSVNRPDVKPAPHTTRAVVLAAWIFQHVKGKQNECLVTRILQMDPKGHIPSFVLNHAHSKSSSHVVVLRQLFGIPAG